MNFFGHSFITEGDWVNNGMIATLSDSQDGHGGGQPWCQEETQQTL